MISEIETEFRQICDLTSQNLGNARKRSLSEQEAKKYFEASVRFQRFLEARQAQLLVFSGVAYFERASTKFEQILNFVTSSKPLYTFQSDIYALQKVGDSANGWESDDGYHIKDQIEGIVVESRQLIQRSRKEDTHAQIRSLEGIQNLLAQMELEFIEFYADLRLMTELMVFPVEQRLRLKDDLISSGFREVVEYVETAEQNLSRSPPHLKDALTNCRQAVESMIYLLMENEGISPERKFAIDLAALSQKNQNLIDEGTKKLIQGTFSYLSEKGPHVLSKVGPREVSEAEFGLNQTYALISLILSRERSIKKRTVPKT